MTTPEALALLERMRAGTADAGLFTAEQDAEHRLALARVTNALRWPDAERAAQAERAHRAEMFPSTPEENGT